MNPGDVGVEVTLAASGPGSTLVALDSQPGVYVAPTVDDQGEMTLHFHACDLAADHAELVDTLRAFADTLELAIQHGGL